VSKKSKETISCSQDTDCSQPKGNNQDETDKKKLATLENVNLVVKAFGDNIKAMKSKIARSCLVLVKSNVIKYWTS
jgi:hypothetical protein